MLALPLSTFIVQMYLHKEYFLASKGLSSTAEESKAEGQHADPKIHTGKYGGTVGSEGARLLRLLGSAGHGCLFTWGRCCETGRVICMHEAHWTQKLRAGTGITTLGQERALTRDRMLTPSLWAAHPLCPCHPAAAGTHGRYKRAASSWLQEAEGGG